MEVIHICEDDSEITKAERSDTWFISIETTNNPILITITDRWDISKYMKYCPFCGGVLDQ